MSTHLVLVFTRGVSLAQWDAVGMLKRELALYEALSHRGVKVTLVTWGGPTDLDYESRLRPFTICCNANRLPQPLYARLLARLHHSALSDADVIKTNQSRGGDTALHIARAVGKPLVARCGYMWSEFEAFEHGQRSLRARWARRIEWRLFSTAAAIVTTTEDMAEAVRRRVPEASGRIHVHPNYVLGDLFAPDPETQPDIDVLYIGRLHPQKNPGVFLDALRRLPGVTAAIVGGGQEATALKESHADLSSRVHWVGSVPHDQLPLWLNRARLYVMPSRYEGHPKTLIEAMSCGRPIVASDVPGIRGVVENDRTALLCSPTPNEFAVAIRDLLDNPERAACLGRAARDEALARYDLPLIAEREARLIHALAGDGPAE